ncbi:uncharacterized protein SPPG_04952 [Spizellomyces punctatus DAOM BR117]|uniref:Uncharacterized protein n=1 Tax=Spizellomyces punctatus (strain DAOM BR117) TaxID=645134 RepID=A0A0L0HFL8_SPIPD|nr:uncharacterized protein SPPG_04952 [Spizellomyces punctatus DAOM BR117]KNC99563.1 hypothetical protein SPPG_04952 [Spizellomyces punctatus DAOM BR117]|eukprot:XP_016607603.1 hypothetical protein SPPG_04952 [Spizellomyces punctatus DAOM BR117]
MLTSDPTHAAAEALVTFHSAPVHQRSSHTPTSGGVSDTQIPVYRSLLSSPAVQPPTLPAPTYTTRPRLCRKPSVPQIATDSPVTDKPMDWGLDSNGVRGTATSPQSGSSVQVDQSLGLGPVDELTDEICDRFQSLRSDIMAVDGSMDLEAYQLAAYDLQLQQMKEEEERARQGRGKSSKDGQSKNDSIDSPSAASTKSRKYAMLHLPRRRHPVKLKPLSPEAIEQAKVQPDDRGLLKPPTSQKVPLPSIRSILSTSGPRVVRVIPPAVAPAAGPVMMNKPFTADAAAYIAYRSHPDAMLSDEETVSSCCSTPQMTSPQPIRRPYLPPPTRTRISSLEPISSTASNGMVVRGDQILPFHHPGPSRRYSQSAPSGELMIQGNDHSVVVPVKRVHVPDPLDDILQQQHQHIQELHHQNMWLQHQLAQVQAQGQQQKKKPLPPNKSVSQATPALTITPAPHRRPCTPCPHHHHHHQPVAPHYKHAHPHSSTTILVPAPPHKKKPYSIVPAPTDQHQSLLQNHHYPEDHLLPSPASSSTPPSPRDEDQQHGQTSMTVYQQPQQSQQQQQQEHPGHTRQTLEKLGEFLNRRTSASKSR